MPNATGTEARRLRASDACVFLALGVVVAAAFGPKLASLGFYNYDWGWLPHLAGDGSGTLLGLARALWGSVPGAFAARPSGLIYFPILFRLFGLDAARYQAFYLCVDAAVAWNFYRLLVEEGVARPQALLAALFAALYPNHDATHHWMTDSAAPFALAGVLWAVRGFRAPQRSGSSVRRWAASFVYAFSVLLYESSALLALLPAVLDFSDLRAEGRKASAAGSEALRRNVAPVSRSWPERSRSSARWCRRFSVSSLTRCL